MGKQVDTIRLLVIGDVASDAEYMINLLRNAGHVVRPKQISQRNELANALQNQAWDLCIIHKTLPSLDVCTIMATILDLGKDIPVIELVNNIDNEQVTQSLNLGIKAVIKETDQQQLVLLAQNELNNLHLRRKYKRLTSALQESEKRCNLLLESSREAIAYIHEGMYIYANAAYNTLFGYHDADELDGLPILDMIAPSDHVAFKKFLKVFQTQEQHEQALKFHGKRKDNSEFSAEISLSHATYHDESCIQIIVRLRDSQRHLDEKIQALSYQDLLTGLYNRQYFMQNLDETISRCATTSLTATLCYIEIKDFSSIKEQIGLGGSDLVISDVADLLRSIVDCEKCLLSRYSDDVFTILMPNTNITQAQELAKNITEKMDDHISEISGGSISLSCSIGICLITETAPSSQEILTRAHAACSDARQNKESIATYTSKIATATQSIDRESIAQIQKALDGGRFQLKYQPIVSLHGEKHQFYEVLLRMLDEDKGGLKPEEFFPAASEGGLLAKMDRWVILHATKVLSEHRLKGHSVYLFVMLTGTSLLDETLLPWITVALKAARLPTDAIIFEISELDAAVHLKQAKAFTQGLNEIHCKVALSHFGSGLDSFNTLKHLHVEYVKLDGSFTEDLKTNSRDAQKNLASTIKALHAKGKLTIVPMVEDARILPTMWQCGVNYIQGYYLHPPGDGLDYNFLGHFEEIV